MVITNEQIAEAIKLYKGGMKMRDISEKLDINTGMISTAIKHLRNLGVDIPRRGAVKRDWNEVANLLK
jgi:Mn-dependent DtxR family transcriptional regulator